MNIHCSNNSLCLCNTLVSYVFLKILSISSSLGGCAYNHLTHTFLLSFVLGWGT